LTGTGRKKMQTRLKMNLNPDSKIYTRIGALLVFEKVDFRRWEKKALEVR